MKRLFTLIELIVVIVVLGLLAAIVIPNVSSFKDEAIRSEVTSNIKNLQTATDRYGLKNDGALPLTLASSVEDPQRVESERLYPTYLSKKASDRGFYWLDHTGAVWGSVVDAPTRVHREGDTLNWQAVPGAKGYQVYGASELDVKGSVDGKTYRYTPLLKAGNEDGKLILGQKVPNADAYDYLLVGSIDRYGLSSVPAGDDYEGYPEQDDFGNFFPLAKEGTFKLTTNAHGKATWDAIVTKEEKPEGTQIKYSFATSDDGKTYTPFTDILTALPQSQYMKVKVEMIGANGKVPTLKSLKVKFHLDEEGENFVVEDTPVEVPVGESFTVIEMPESGYFQEVVIGYREDGYVPSVTYQSSVDGVTYSEPSRYPETLPAGEYLKVTFEAEQPLFVDSIAVIQSPSDPNVAPVEPSPTQREGDATQNPPTEGSNPGSGTPEEETEDWVVTSEFEVIEDATVKGDWLSVDKVDTQPTGTKIEYTYYTSEDESTWSGPYSTVDAAPDSRFFKVDMKFMRMKDSNELASVEELTINYISNGKNMSKTFKRTEQGMVATENYDYVNTFPDATLPDGEIAVTNTANWHSDVQLSANGSSMIYRVRTSRYTPWTSYVEHYDVETGAKRTLDLTSTSIEEVVMSDNGRTILYTDSLSDSFGDIYYKDLMTGSTGRFDPSSNQVMKVSKNRYGLSANGQVGYYAESAGGYVVKEVVTGKVLLTLPSTVRDLQLSGDGEKAFYVEGSKIVFHDLKTNTKVERLPKSVGTGYKFNPSGTYAAVQIGSYMKRWEVETDTYVDFHWDSDTSRHKGYDISNDGDTVVYSYLDYDGTMRGVVKKISTSQSNFSSRSTNKQLMQISADGKMVTWLYIGGTKTPNVVATKTSNLIPPK